MIDLQVHMLVLPNTLISLSLVQRSAQESRRKRKEHMDELEKM